MRTKQSNEADGQTNPAGSPLAPRDRVLEVACALFAETGFHGTHLREICRRAETNVAGVCYQFQSKNGLYQAVVMEAGRRLANHEEDSVASSNLPPEQKLLKLVESLLQKLSAEGAWTAKLLTRELVDAVCGANNNAVPGLERDFVQLQAVIRELIGAKANNEAIRLHALSVISECVFYCLAGENLHHALIQIGVRLPSRAHVALFITQRTLGALQLERAEPEISNS